MWLSLYGNYAPALTDYDHNPEEHDPKIGHLKWLHIIISKTKAFILEYLSWSCR